MSVKIETKKETVIVTAPYTPQFPGKAKNLGGKWLPNSKVWQFDIRDEGRVRDLCKEIYGTDGLAEQKLVTVKMEVYENGSELWRFGRLIAQRPGRDSAVKLGDGVVVISGKFPGSGGSRNHPSISDRSEAVTVEVRDIPEALALTEIEKHPETMSLVEEVEVKTLSPLAPFGDAELIAELERRGYKVTK